MQKMMEMERESPVSYKRGRETDFETKKTLFDHPLLNHPIALPVTTLILGCVTLMQAVGIFEFIVVRPWKNMVTEFVVLLLVGSALLFVSLRGFLQFVVKRTEQPDR